MPGVCKMSMARMHYADKPANERDYKEARQKCLGHNDVLQVRRSKHVCHERPYAVTGGIQLAGPEQAPKDING